MSDDSINKAVAECVSKFNFSKSNSIKYSKSFSTLSLLDKKENEDKKKKKTVSFSDFQTIFDASSTITNTTKNSLSNESSSSLKKNNSSILNKIRKSVSYNTGLSNMIRNQVSDIQYNYSLKKDILRKGILKKSSSYDSGLSNIITPTVKKKEIFTDKTHKMKYENFIGTQTFNNFFLDYTKPISIKPYKPAKSPYVIKKPIINLNLQNFNDVKNKVFISG